MEPQRVAVFDTTLRDGEQAPGCGIGVKDKLRLARQLDQLGVDVIEAGFPVASESESESVKLIAVQVQRPVIATLARATKQDVESAWIPLQDARHPRLHVFLATSDLHLECKLRITRTQALDYTFESVAHARSLCDDVEFSAEDATRSDVGFLCKVLGAAVAAGATVINIPDTVGYAVPDEFARLIRTIRQNVPGIEKATISVHCHDDLGLAVANSLAAFNAGARQVECTINGIGERAGNASLEEVVMVLAVRHDRLPFATAVNTGEIYRTSRLLAEIIGVEPQPNKAIVGKNAFAHEAGIHQHGVLRNPLCYEIMKPEAVGVAGNTLVLGKHSGRHALARRLFQLGRPASGSEADAIYLRFMKLAENKKEVSDQDLMSLFSTCQREASTADSLSSEDNL